MTVTASQPATGLTRTSVTGGQGEWTIPTLPTGDYTVTFELSSFKKLVRPNVTVESGVPRSVNVTLELGAVSESITVTGGAELLAPTTATTFRRLSAEELTLIPTTTRSFTHLLSSEAGVSADLPPALVNGTGNISPSVNGTRTTSTSLFFNGIDATNVTSNEGSLSDNIAPAPETLEEVKLQTSLYDAATGRSGGGNFQLITRGGSNVFKGSGYFDFQHEKMNANDFFYDLDGIDKPKARRNEGGFTLGGPVKQNKVFFFGAYQRTQAETAFVPTASSITVLPAALRLIQGDRTKENLHAAFASLNPSFLTSIPKAQCSSPADNQCITDVGFALFSLRNPVTGDYRFRRRAPAWPRRASTSSRARRSVAIRWCASATCNRRSSSRIRSPPASTRSSRTTTGFRSPASSLTSRRSIRSRIRPVSRLRSRCVAPTATARSRSPTR